ncbi:hypothetical protein [Bacillus sp. JJ1127]|uniref:hypothetical protein n=1 Tax=Bacillus sp. JJ1127 TaxID=3122952 RepID=UPI002FFE95E0
MNDLNRCQKLLVRYKYKLNISVIILMGLDLLLIKGFVDLFSKTLNSLLLIAVALLTVGSLL